LLILPHALLAQDVQLNFTSSVFFLNCEINTTSQYQIINLGDWKKESFTTVGSRSPAVPFNISLRCPGNSRLQVYFAGQADPNNGQLLALDDINDKDRGIGVRLMNASGNAYNINDYTPFRSVTSSSDTLSFQASYESTRPMNEIQPGPAVATMMFTMNYE
ncbi:fimbrial protein, partial [Enterobacter cloacae complex sp. P4RS]